MWQIPNKDQVKDQLAETEKKVFTGDSSSDWLGSDRDYTYDELLTRVFNIIREKNPDMITGEKKKFVMKPPQVARVGTKKTSFSNFADICKLLRRQEKHLLNFLLAELGTSGSLDIQKQLTIKGRFQQKQIENVLRRYISNQKSDEHRCGILLDESKIQIFLWGKMMNRAVFLCETDNFIFYKKNILYDLFFFVMAFRPILTDATNRSFSLSFFKII